MQKLNLILKTNKIISILWGTWVLLLIITLIQNIGNNREYFSQSTSFFGIIFVLFLMFISPFLVILSLVFGISSIIRLSGFKRKNPSPLDGKHKGLFMYSITNILMGMLTLCVLVFIFSFNH